jgi:enterobactin synthetase component D / holo-[acyl-carrier protein] synthase
LNAEKKMTLHFDIFPRRFFWVSRIGYFKDMMLAMKRRVQKTEVPFGRLFKKENPIGLCVGIALPLAASPIPGSILARLHPEEQKYAAALPLRRRITWVGGRIALREALDEIGAECGPVLPDERGAPILPKKIAASIAHKTDIAVALVSKNPGWSVGVDVEHIKPDMDRIVRRVMSAEEIEELDALPQSERSSHALICFSLKEAYYKAQPQDVQRGLFAKDIFVSPGKNGKALIRCRGQKENQASRVKIFWELKDGIILCAAGRPMRGRKT